MCVFDGGMFGEVGIDFKAQMQASGGRARQARE